MDYTKLATTFPQQADKLISRGLIADKDILIERLRAVSYFRLSGYLFPFRNKNDDNFKDGTNFETVWKRYTFDRRLRILIMDALERLEVAVRTRLVYKHSHAYGAFGYIEPTNLPKLTSTNHDKFLIKVDEQTRQSREVFVKHFRDKYGDSHDRLPIWMTAEIMTFGMLLTMFKGIETTIKQEIASEYRISDWVLESWLRSLNGIRNICAHHGRLWNREIGDKPKIPKGKKHPEWHEPIEIHNNRIFGILTVLKYLINIIAPQSKWPERFLHLLEEYPEIPLIPMGFPENWRDCPIWINEN